MSDLRTCFAPIDISFYNTQVNAWTSSLNIFDNRLMLMLGLHQSKDFSDNNMIPMMNSIRQMNNLISIPNWVIPISILFIPAFKWINDSSTLKVKSYIYTPLILYGIFHLCAWLVFLNIFNGGSIYAGSIITLFALCFLLYRRKRII